MINTDKSKRCGKQCIFNDCCIYIFPSGLGKKRLSLFETQIINYGGQLAKLKGESSSATHIVIEDSLTCDLEKLKTYLKNATFHHGETAKIVRIQWLSKCLKENKYINTHEFEITIPKEKSTHQSVNAENPIGVDPLSEVASCSDYHENNSVISSCMVHHPPPKKLKTDLVENFFCSQASHQNTTQCNQLIVSELQKLADAYRASGDIWRTHGYNKAVTAIKAYGKEIKSYEEAVNIRNLGEKMAVKINEILEYGKLRKVEEVCNTEKMKVLELFTKVWGAGPSTAEGWYMQGYRTLEDLNTKANLTAQQKIGLKHYHDLQIRIPRQEVERIGNVVHEAALALDPTLTVLLVGSYRRGKDTCGDVDVMISKNEGVTPDILTSLWGQLKQTGFITDDLINLDINGKHMKYLGVCQLPGKNQTHRRLDIFVVCEEEFAPALVHYTGSALFNRSIRCLAAKKGMSLTEHCLIAGIVRQGKEKLNSGYIIPTPTEESIFEHLGLEYRPPEERDH